jgi:hypothetical protein
MLTAGHLDLRDAVVAGLTSPGDGGYRALDGVYLSQLHRYQGPG